MVETNANTENDDQEKPKAKHPSEIYVHTDPDPKQDKKVELDKMENSHSVSEK